MLGRSLPPLALAAALLTTACSGAPVDCGPCPPPTYVTIANPQILPAAAQIEIEVCVASLPCQRVEREAADVAVVLDTADRLTAAELEGATVRATATRGDRSYEATATMRYHEDPPGDCACSYAYAELVLTRS